ncbi:sporulation protein YpjB [Sporolactobacillus putidus]|uniref:Sporulation protein YpjB n=1 Tax=Sporolactobacillus putidus TaxID=492735 RepID=A0A917RZN2_9BACL|nr:sporulation protein YpjB [Sporolactobacillus putidus]GGL47260.1 sporulation protein YpjB [Sporolactobacillus putidus]
MKTEFAAVLLCLMFFFIGPHYGYARTSDKNIHEQELNNLSDRIFQYADANQEDAAKNLLSEFDRTWSTSETAYPDEDGRIVGTVALRLKILLDSGGNSSEIRDAAIALRLCVDALTTSGSPLWKAMRSQVLGPIKGMQTSLKNQDYPGFQAELNQFLDSYALIYPSMMIDGNPEGVIVVNKSVNAFADQRMSTIQDKMRIQQLTLIEKELAGVFDRSPASTIDSLSPLILAVGSFLLFVLIYVSLRKYFGERFKRRKEIR